MLKNLSTNPWLEKVDARFIRLAVIIYEQSPFDFAMIGEKFQDLPTKQLSPIMA
ncbi:hypothetical protein QMK38_04490 [Lysinibacillus fusiformis]|nr:hypothetical protein [Lysinibacillus fusiformis]